MDISRFRRNLNAVAVKYKKQITFLFVVTSAFTAVVSRVVDRRKGGRWILNLEVKDFSLLFYSSFLPNNFRG